jgi:hypothetical protein
MDYYEDHGLPLVQLKEQRRELVVALIGRKEISNAQIAEIASLQQAIAAMEAVVGDLDSQTDEFSPSRRQAVSAFSIRSRGIVANMDFVFGRRAVAPPTSLRLAD